MYLGTMFVINAYCLKCCRLDKVFKHLGEFDAKISSILSNDAKMRQIERSQIRFENILVIVIFAFAVFVGIYDIILIYPP